MSQKSNRNPRQHGSQNSGEQYHKMDDQLNQLHQLMPPVPSIYTEPPVLRGMNTVRVKTEDVLQKLKTNRQGHRKVFEEALEGYHQAVIEHLEGALEDALAGKKFNPSIWLPEPQDHTKDYDRVIALLSMSLDEELELNSVEFAQYVLDDWGWKGDFIATSANYTNLR